MKIIKTNNPTDPATFLAKRVIEKLESNKKVLWFATGGSSIAVQILAAKIISEHLHSNLTVTLTDERFGEVGHKNSNWQKSLDGGFILPQATLFPILIGKNREETVENFNKVLKEEISKADYKIGLFGVGPDGHTAGILPNSPAVTSLDQSFGYQTANFERITITPNAIKKFDEAVVFMQGKDKWPIIKDLQEKNIDLETQPAQILKSIPLVTIFTDYPKI